MKKHTFTPYYGYTVFYVSATISKEIKKGSHLNLKKYRMREIWIGGWRNYYAREGEKIGIVDTDRGIVILEPIYDILKIEDYKKEDENRIIIEATFLIYASISAADSNLWGMMYIDWPSHEVTEYCPCIYEMIKKVNSGDLFYRNGKVRFDANSVDDNTAFWEKEYDGIAPFFVGNPREAEERFIVSEHNKEYLVDSKGKKLSLRNLSKEYNELKFHDPEWFEILSPTLDTSKRLSKTE